MAQLTGSADRLSTKTIKLSQKYNKILDMTIPNMLTDIPHNIKRVMNDDMVKIEKPPVIVSNHDSCGEKFKKNYLQPVQELVSIF